MRTLQSQEIAAKERPHTGQPQKERLQKERPRPGRRLTYTITVYALLVIIAAITLAPLAYTISGSFKTNAGVLEWPPRLIPKPPVTSNYAEVWNSSPLFPRWIVNSVFLALVHVAAELFFASLAGYAFARMKFPGRDLIFMIMLGTLMIPPPVTVVSKYIIVARLGWVNTYLGVIMPTLVTVFGVFLMTQFIRAIPKDLDEAATIDGCSRFGIYWRIVLPLSKPALSALAIFAFKDSWNEFMWSLTVLNSPELFTLPLGLNYFRGQFYTFWNLVLAGSMFNIAPILIVFIIFQRYFIKGIAMSGLKG